MDERESFDRSEDDEARAGADERIPMEQSDLVQKLKDETSGEPLGDKAEAGVRELSREVSGTYEARQEEAAPEKVKEELE